MTRNEIITNNVLIEDYETPSSSLDGTYTKTTQFMLPAVGVNAKNKIIFKFFLNSYLDDSEHLHEYTRPIFVLFGVDNFNNKEWQKVYSALVQSSNYITDYDCGRQNKLNLVMMVFGVPEEYAKDYYHFKRGRYSQFSEAYKDKFPKWIQVEGNREIESVIWQVINKSPILKDKIAEEFVCKRDDGSMFATRDFDLLRADIDTWDEIWDRPRKKREYFRYKEAL